MENKFGDKLSELDLTNDEIKRLSECMKDEKFVDLLRDYAMEISDPENKKKYEEEIAMMELERGNDVKFIHPCPGHVLKTSCEGDQKCFINICSSPKVGKPISKPSVKGSTRGMQWSIPHSLSQPREDLDKAGGKCVVYDVVFNPDTYHMAQKNARFRKMIHDMALDAVERLFQVTLDKVNVKKPKMKFKGFPQASMIRTPSEATRELNAKSEEDSDDPLMFPYPSMSNGQDHKDPKPTQKTKDAPKSTTSNIKKDVASEFVEPKYTMTHRGYFDMKDYYTIPDYSVVSTRPRELILNIELPMLKAASALHLEIFEERVFLECAKPVKYKLDLQLPFPVDDSKGHARFDKSKRKLTITLEVLPPKMQQTFLPSKIGQEENENACGSCSREEKAKLPENQEDNEDALEEENPAENELLPSDHPSGLIHGRSKCRHQNHGALWSKDYAEDTVSESAHNMSFLHKTSPKLIEKLAGSLSAKAKPDVIGKARPQIFYHQDENFITILVSVKYIDAEKLWYVLSPDNLQFSCISKENRNDLIYQLFLKFQKKEIIDPRRSRVDVSDDNAVFLLRKHVSCEHEWQSFEAGFDSLNLKKLSFATESNINSLITSVKQEAQNSVTREFECEDVMGSQNSELLALKLLPKEVVDEFRLSVEDKKEKDVDELPVMEKTLDQINEIRGEIGSDAKIDHEKVILEAMNTQDSLSQDAESITDEDDDSDTYETADSSEEEPQKQAAKTVENEPERAKIPTPMARKNDKTDLSSDIQMIDGDASTDIQKPSNEPLVVREFEKDGDSEGKTKVVTDHKTKSVVKLSNEMLFEIDSD